VGGALSDAGWIFVVVLVLIVLAAAVLASRRYLLERSGGTVECALRLPAGSGAWRLGVLSYQHDSLRWHGALGLLLRPEYVFHRRALSVVSRRPAEPSETVTIGADRIVVEVAVEPTADGPGPLNGKHAELAMTEQALTGFLAWLEASPPGSYLGDLSLPAPHRSPPGRHRTSPAPAFAVLARMNSRSESRFRYLAGQTLTVSPWAATAAHAVRSARRATARAVCSRAAPGVPPGSTNDRRVGSAALYSSHAASSAVT